MNRIIVTGFISRDVEVQTFQNGVAAKFSINDGNGYKDKTTGNWVDTSTWFTVTWFPETWDTSYMQITKGSKITVMGTLSHRKYQDSNNEIKDAWSIIADKRDGVSIVCYTPRNERGSQAQTSTQSQASSPIKKEPLPKKKVEAQPQETEDDLPF